MDGRECVVVTGGNRGIGLEACRQLARRGLRVILTGRDLGQAQAAAARLEAEDGGPARAEGWALDVGDAGSTAAFAARLQAEGTPVHALINNAGVSLHGFDVDRVAATLNVNYFGAVRVTEALVPLMPRGARVVMVSSGMGELSGFAPSLRARFLDPALDRPALDALVASFVDAVRRQEHERQGWPGSAYRVSKAALNTYVRLLAPSLAARGILVNAVCPGWVRTDMGGSGAPRPVEEGAAGVVWAAMLPPDGPTGGFFRDGRPIDW